MSKKIPNDNRRISVDFINKVDVKKIRDERLKRGLEDSLTVEEINFIEATRMLAHTKGMDIGLEEIMTKQRLRK